MIVVSFAQFLSLRKDDKKTCEIKLLNPLNQKIYISISIDITNKIRIYKKMLNEITKMLTKDRTLLRFPRLDTILLVEDFIKEHDGEFRKKQLWQALPKKMMYQTFSIIIDYLLISGKISVDSKGKIGWIFYPKEVKERLKKAHLIWKG